MHWDWGWKVENNQQHAPRDHEPLVFSLSLYRLKAKMSSATGQIILRSRQTTLHIIARFLDPGVPHAVQESFVYRLPADWSWTAGDLETRLGGHLLRPYRTFRYG